MAFELIRSLDGRPLWGTPTLFADWFAGYQFKAPCMQVPLNLQLNVRNAFNFPGRRRPAQRPGKRFAALLSQRAPQLPCDGRGGVLKPHRARPDGAPAPGLSEIKERARKESSPDHCFALDATRDGSSDRKLCHCPDNFGGVNPALAITARGSRADGSFIPEIFH